jgi:segregation and condensation protein A
MSTLEQATTPSSYRVTLSFFSGPLDLLLYLVRRDEYSTRDLSLSRLTSQFVEYLSVLEVIDLELASEFVVVASTLLEIKSREVLPAENELVDELEEVPLNDGPASGLIKKLLEYRRIREAAQALENQAIEWQARYPRLSDERPVIGKTPSADRIKEVELWDLVSALGRVLKKDEVQAEGRILYDDTPIEVYVEQIGARVRAEGEVFFTKLFDQETIRSRIVGMFLAILELLRHHGYRAVQEGLFGEIRVLPPLPREEPDLAITDPVPAVTEVISPPTVS